MESKQNKLIYINFTFMIIIGVFSVLGFVAFLKSSKSNFQASSTNYCIPCADKSGNSYTNTDGTSVPCRTIEDWLKTKGVSFIDDGSGNEIMTVTQSQKLLNYNANNTQINSYVNVDKLLSNSVYYEMMNLFNMSFANVNNFTMVSSTGSALPLISVKDQYGNYDVTNTLSELYLINYLKSTASPGSNTGGNDYIYTPTFMELINNFFNNKPPTIQVYIGCKINQSGQTYDQKTNNNVNFDYNTYTVMYTEDSLKSYYNSGYINVKPPLKPLNPTGITTNLTPNVYTAYDGYQIKIPESGIVPGQIQVYNSDTTNNSDANPIIRTLYMFAVYDNYRFNTKSFGESYPYIINAIDNAPYLGNGL
jgi:hypothetical protein